VVGARGKASAPAAPPGAEGSAAANIPSVTLSGKVTVRLDLPVKIDIFAAGAAGGSARKHLGKVDAVGGAWSAKVVPRLGGIVIEAYQDPGGDGPTKGDPVARYPGVVTVGDASIAGLDLTLP